MSKLTCDLCSGAAFELDYDVARNDAAKRVNPQVAVMRRQKTVETTKHVSL
jgi:hypothetical protein